MPRMPFLMKPGFVQTESDYAAEGRYIAGDKTRFHRARAEKIGGAVRYYKDGQFQGVGRGLIGWFDNSGRDHLGIGTHLKLYTWQGGTLMDITPFSSTGTLGANPVTVSDGSKVVTIAHPTHNRGVGDFVHFAGATPVGGISINGEWQVNTIAADGNSYTIVAATAAHVNYLLRSEELDNAAWTKTEVTVAANGANDSTGTATLDKLTETLNNNLHSATQTVSTSPAQTWYLQAEFKNSSGTRTGFLGIYDPAAPSNTVRAYFDLSTGTVTAATNFGNASGATASIVDLGGGLYRCRLSGQPNTSGTQTAVYVGLSQDSTVSYVGDGSSAIFVGRVDLGLTNGNYTANVATAPTPVTGGGSAITYQYEIPVGRVDTIPGYGFGVGKFGAGKFGMPSTVASIELPARLWSLDLFGEDLLALPRGGNLYVWDTSAAGRATLVATAPQGNRFMFESDDKKTILLGAGGDPMRMQWSHTADYTLWTPAPDNDAGSKQLVGGSALRAGARGRGFQCIWSDTDFFLAKNLYSDLIYDVERVGTEAGIIAPLAFAELEGVFYWMGQNGFYMSDGSSLQPVPNQDDVRQAIFSDVNMAQMTKFHAGANARFREAWFWWVSRGGKEIDRYAVYDADDRVWVTGTWDRTSYELTGIETSPIALTPDGWIVQHETGLDEHDGTALYAWLRSAPFELADGDALMDVFGVLPDTERQVGNMTWTFYAQEYPRDPEHQEEAVVVRPDSKIEDLHSSGREMSVLIENRELGGDFRLGKPRLEVQQAGLRR